MFILKVSEDLLLKSTMKAKYIVSCLILCILCTSLVECCFMRQMHTRLEEEPDTQSTKRTRTYPAGISPFDRKNCGRTGLFTMYNYVSQATNAQINEFPWVVSIQEKGIYDFKHKCTGSLIAYQYVVTSAHCFYRESIKMPIKEIRTSMKVISGTDYLEPYLGIHASGTQSAKIKHVWFRKDYTLNRRGKHNIVVVKLRHKLHSPVRPICLPSKSVKIKSTLVIAGWPVKPRGNQDIHKLVKSVEPIDHRLHYCKNSAFNNLILCSVSNPQNICMDDSGGPAMIQKHRQMFLMGIVAEQYSCTGGVNIYTNVKAQRKWIKKVVIKMENGRAPPRRSD